MKIIFNIARIELRILFTSPVAFIVLAAFAIIAALPLEAGLGLVSANVSAPENNADASSITYWLFSKETVGIFSVIQKQLYLLMPLLTMGMMSRETSSGSIKLLLSSPIKIRSIILGKYLALVIYGLIVLSILAIMAGAIGSVIAHADATLLLSGLLGLFCLYCLYAAIGLLMSCITQYQIVAAIFSFALLSLMQIITYFFQYIPWWRDLSYQMSITGRTRKMIDGLILSSDLVYFILGIAFFLGIAIIRLQFQRKPAKLLTRTGGYLSFITVILLVGYLFTRPGLTLYVDMTAQKEQTLTVNSINVMKSFDGPVTITTYVNLLDYNAWSMGTPLQRNEDIDWFKPYARFMKELKMEYIYFYDSIPGENVPKKEVNLSLKDRAGNRAARMYIDMNQVLSPQEIKRRIDLSRDENRSVRILRWKGKEVVLQGKFGDLQERGRASEQEITTAFKQLFRPASLIAYVEGHGERSLVKKQDSELHDFFAARRRRQAMINQGFEIRPVNLNQEPIPDNTSILVIAAPQTTFSEDELLKISNYVASGGDLFLLGEPGTENILNPVIQPLGVTMLTGRLEQHTIDYNPDFIGVPVTPYIETLGSSVAAQNTYYEDKLRITMSGATGFRFNDSEGFKIHPLTFIDSSIIWLPNFPSNKTPHVFSKGDPAISTALSLVRKMPAKEQRILLFSDADFITMRLLKENASVPFTVPGNFYVGLFYRWFNEGEFPVNVVRPPARDTYFSVSQASTKTLQKILVYGLPAMIILGGGILLLKRRRH